MRRENTDTAERFVEGTYMLGLGWFKKTSLKYITSEEEHQIPYREVLFSHTTMEVVGKIQKDISDKILEEATKLRKSHGMNGGDPVRYYRVEITDVLQAIKNLQLMDLFKC